jgi:transposase
LTVDDDVIVTVGVDTHTDVHVAAALDQTGRLLGTAGFPATTRGYARLATWAESFGMAVAPQLIALPGVGVDTAGQLLVTAGDNPQRLHSEAAFARLCGSAPIPVSSGRTDRHRLHRGGDRRANTALWRIALIRMHCHHPAKDYVARRTAEGKTKTEILRCLKRYIAREVYPF